MVMNNELERMWKEVFWPNLNYYLGIGLEGLRKTTKLLSLRFEFMISQLSSRSSVYSTVMFGFVRSGYRY
jgi:hypothetical protein